MSSVQGVQARMVPVRSFGLGRSHGRRSRPAGRRGSATPAARAGKTPPTAPSWLARAASQLDRTRVLLIAALVACATLPYLNILFNGFVYDDDTQVVLNPYVRSLRYLKEILTTNVWSFAGGDATNYYRPVMTLGYLVCYHVFGLRAYGFHLVSLLLHVLVVCFIFLLTERLTGDRVWALVAGALFALHPIHTESVAWIAAVTDLELTFFYLLAFGLFLAAARPVRPRPLDGRPARQVDKGYSTPTLVAMGATFLLALF